jgi:hypothetical protein
VLFAELAERTIEKCMASILPASGDTRGDATVDCG